MNFNKLIDQAILTPQGLHMEINCLMQLKSKYLLELEMLKLNQTDFTSLKLSEKREESRPHFQSLESGLITREAPQGKSVAHLRVKDFIQLDDGLSSMGATSFQRETQALAANPDIIGLVISGASGGGESIGGQKYQNAVDEFNKPVVALVDYMYSAGYRLITGSDYIMMSGESSGTGSIGSMYELNKNFKAFYKKNYETIYSPDSPDKNLEFREWLKGNNGPFLESAKESDNIFMDTVANRRPLKGDIKKTLSGGTFKGLESIERGLADGMGTMKDAVQKVIDMAGAKPTKDYQLQKLEKLKEYGIC